MVALTLPTGCIRGCRRRTRSRKPHSTPTPPTGPRTSPGALCRARVCSGVHADASRNSCAWSEKPCLDPLPQTQQCLFFTVRHMCRITSSNRLRRGAVLRSCGCLSSAGCACNKSHSRAQASCTELRLLHQACRRAQDMTASRTCVTPMRAASGHTRCEPSHRKARPG